MNKAEIEKAIQREVEEWPGVTVEFVSGGKHPKVKFTYLGNMLARPYPGSPSDAMFGIHRTLGDCRRALKQLGAQRPKPEPTKEEDEAPYRKPNDGADKRPHPVEGELAEPKPDVADQLVAVGVATEEDRTRVQAERVRGWDLAGVAGPVSHPASDEEDDEAEARRAAIRDAASAIVDGVYFDLPPEVYHAVQRLSASGLQRLCVSPATFWRGSWLDPDAPELDEEQTKAQQLGKAYHVARLEPHRFHETYCRLPDKEDYGKGLITSDAGIKAALKELGEPQSQGTETIVDRANRLLEAGHEGPVWAVIMDAFELERAGRIPIPAKYFDQIEQDMERIRGSGEIAELLTGGEAEVSIFWTDQHGLKCKCRIDYLTPEWWDDFKTFDNSRGKMLEQALADAMRYNRYHVQASHYRDGVEAVRSGGVDIVGEASDEQRRLIAAIRIKPDELSCWYVFQEKGGVPNLLAREFPFYDVPLQTRLNNAGATAEQQATAEAATRTRSGLFVRAQTDVEHAKRLFVLYSQAYDPGTPWFPLNARARFSDLDFNTYWLEGKA